MGKTSEDYSDELLAALPAQVRDHVDVYRADALPPALPAVLAALCSELETLLPGYRLEVGVLYSWPRFALSEGSWHPPTCPTHTGTRDECNAATDNGAHDAHEERASLANRLVERAELRAHHGSEPRPVPADPRPVLAVDIDGVLNVLSAIPAPHLIIRQGVIPAGTISTPFVHRGGRVDLDLRLAVDPEVIAWLNALIADANVDVVWATSWEEAARSCFAPAAGLGDMRVGISTQLLAPRLSQDLAHWKANALEGAFPGRPLIWIDDMAGPFAHRVWRHPDDDEHTLVLVPDPQVGVTLEHRSAIESFLDRYTQPAL